jgi:hypothetical protein
LHSRLLIASRSTFERLEIFPMRRVKRGDPIFMLVVNKCERRTSGDYKLGAVCFFVFSFFHCFPLLKYLLYIQNFSNKDHCSELNNGSLAPQDYHRFHSPVDGKIGPMTYISGEYYTVNVCSILNFY